MARTSVLIVEDEEKLADLYANWLEGEFDIQTVYRGEDALELLDRDFDVILLDRRLPGMPGDEVLKEIRNRGKNASVAMVTAVEPDFDVIEMGFDDYIVKPVWREELIALIERLVNLESYDKYIQRYYQLATKKAALESAKAPEELAGSDEYADLIAEFEEVKARVDAMVEGASTDDLLDLI